MAIVLQTQLLLDPNNQIAHLADYTGLDVEQEYLISAPFLQADTRFHFLGYFDIALSRPPLNVPQAQTEVPATISTVPLPAAATPPAAYPFALNDRLVAVGLNVAFENTPGVTPPHGNGGTSHLGRIWLDTSGGANTYLRMCKVPTASSGYVAAEWADLFQINTGTGQIQIPGVTGQFVRLTGDTMSGNLTIAKDSPNFGLQANPGTSVQIVGLRGSSPRWYFEVPNSSLETGSNAGSNFSLNRCDDAGNYSGTVLAIYRQTGDASFGNNLSAAAYQLNGTTFAMRGAVHTSLYNAAGQPALYLGSTSDPTNYYDNTSHMFRFSDHATVLASFTTNGLIVGTQALLREGETVHPLAGTGHITAHGNITADGNISGVGLYGNTLNINGSGSFTGTVYAGGFSTGGTVSGGAFSGSSCNISGGTITSFNTTNITVSGSPVCNAGLYVTGGYSGDGLGRTIYCNGSIYVASEVQANVVRARGLDGTYSIGMYQDGASSFHNFYPSIYLSWQQANGNLHYINGNGLHTVWTASSGIFQNFQGGVTAAGAYTNTSDRRTKENIAPTTRGLPEILGLVPVEFTRITPPGIEMPGVERPLELGFVAQDVYEVLPEAVWAIADVDGTVRETEPILGLTSETIVAALVNAVKTLEQRISLLEIAK